VERFTAIEAARRLRRHPEVVRRWLREGRIRGEKFGRDWTVTARELERFRRQEPERRRKT
jgi:excisionase family DNA binding protein